MLMLGARAADKAGGGLQEVGHAGPGGHPAGGLGLGPLMVWARRSEARR